MWFIFIFCNGVFLYFIGEHNGERNLVERIIKINIIETLKKINIAYVATTIFALDFGSKIKYGYYIPESRFYGYVDDEMTNGFA